MKLNLQPFWVPLVICLLSVFNASGKLPDNLDLVIGTNNGPYEERFVAVKNLLNGEIINHSEDIYEFLRSNQNDLNLTSTELFTIKNNLLDRLTSIERLQYELPGLFLGILQDDDQPIVWRDYVVQKARRIIPYCNKTERGGIVSEVWDLIEERRGTIAGTALIALKRIAEKHHESEISISRLSMLSLQIASDSSYSDGSRLTALSIASNLDLSKAKMLSRQILNDDRNAKLLLMVALSVIGQNASVEDVETLKTFRRNSDLRLRNVARKSLERLGESESG